MFFLHPLSPTFLESHCIKTDSPWTNRGSYWTSQFCRNELIVHWNCLNLHRYKILFLFSGKSSNFGINGDGEKNKLADLMFCRWLIYSGLLPLIQQFFTSPFKIYKGNSWILPLIIISHLLNIPLNTRFDLAQFVNTYFKLRFLDTPFKSIICEHSH